MNAYIESNKLNILDYKINPYEIYKSDEDISIISFNNSGSMLAICTKSNCIAIFDFMTKSLIFEINFFVLNKENNCCNLNNIEKEKLFKYKVLGIVWHTNSKNILVYYSKEIIIKSKILY